MTAIMNKNKNNSGEGAYNAILKGIMSGELKPGLIVSEHTLSEMYNVGRTPVREALKRLEGEGFIINSDRKKKIYSLTVDDVREIFDLKMEIEGMVAYKAASSKNKKPIYECLADEIMLAAKGDMTSYAVAKKEEVERVAQSAR